MQSLWLAIGKNWRGWLNATLLPVLLTALLIPLREQISSTDVAMLQLVWISWMAQRYGKTLAIATTLVSVLVLNWCFVPPYYTLDVHDTRNLISFVVMASLGIFISYLSDRINRQLQKSRNLMSQLRAMYMLSKGLAGRSDWQSQCAFAQKLLSRRLRAEVQVVANCNKPAAAAGMLQLQLGKNAAVGWLLLPESLLLPNHTLIHAAQSLLGQSYAALELQQQANKNLLQVESEQQRAMLLRSLSHDLRTPLATIMGASSMLADQDLVLSDEQRQQQALNIYRHSKLLHQHFEKVLELSKAQLADVQLQRSHFSSDDLIAGALGRRSELAADIAAKLSCPPAQALTGDADLLEIALANLLENALKYGAAPFVLSIETTHGWQRLVLKNALSQNGLTPRAAADAGHGLGLRICETVAALHGGRFSLQLKADTAKRCNTEQATAAEAVATLEWPL
ncbi:DUF4118 domain-containing protein [Rheinheimera sp.]|uniref:sensor histidine kinase n=1 Tax=Rheinheimera sp. TaxID=1869214 RepID=UPI0027B987C3|nr:DUF4118 domain-containing protein [Rheinheimera sp.]